MSITQVRGGFGEDTDFLIHLKYLTCKDKQIYSIVYSIGTTQTDRKIYKRIFMIHALLGGDTNSLIS